MNKAEEYYKEYHPKIGRVVTLADLINFAEAYHQSRVNGISDENIEKQLIKHLEDNHIEASKNRVAVVMSFIKQLLKQ
jgi:hypothetical protein